jgi:hypothetical protein
LHCEARVAKLADARDLKSRVSKETYRFDSDPGHQPNPFTVAQLGPLIEREVGAFEIRD